MGFIRFSNRNGGRNKKRSIILIAVLVFNIGYIHGEKLETEKHEKEEMVKSDEIHESDVKEITITTKRGKTYYFSSSEGDDK